jgi:pimeloyl-ACP methyl ester carboxylesterase
MTGPQGTDLGDNSKRGSIVFSHGNGFAAGTYRVLFEAWRAAGWQVLALPRFGHDPNFPVSGNWPHLRDELLAFIDAAVASGRAPGPLHLVGHSLGGYLSLMAACRRPALASSLVLIDSPVVAGWRAHGLQVAKASGLVQRVTPGRVSRTRRHTWPSAEAALRHFGAKAVFQRWDPRVLRDYISAGTEPDPVAQTQAPAADGSQPVKLAFDRRIETHIYNTVPHGLGELARRHPPQGPVHFIAGTQSAEVRQVTLAATRALVQRSGGHLCWMAGSHLLPMERPDATAAAVLALLKGELPALEVTETAEPTAAAAGVAREVPQVEMQ